MAEDIQLSDGTGGILALLRETAANDATQMRRELYVALDLRQMPIDEARALAEAHRYGEMPPVVECDDSAYYHLTPVQFAWLHSRMNNAKAAHKAGRLSAATWAQARMRWNEMLEKATRAYGRKELEDAVKAFKSGTYRLPELSSAVDGLDTRPIDSSPVPASCPYTLEYMQKAALDHPDIVPCPLSGPKQSAWWWVEKNWCDTKCEGHRDCIRQLFWSAPAKPRNRQ
jgi:hypothetical protein